MSQVTGHTDADFTSVRRVFESFFADGRETGAGVAVVHRGRLVVDLVGGPSWTPRTVVAVYSVSKPFAAACLMILVDRGRVGLDDPVHRHWPEFPDDGTTVRHVLAHTAGRPVFPVAPRLPRRLLRALALKSLVPIEPFLICLPVISLAAEAAPPATA